METKPLRKVFAMLEDSTRIYGGCQRISGLYSGFIDNTVYSGPLRCNSWSCKTCAPKKRSKLVKRILNGPLCQQGVSKHAIKFVTLTFGGMTEREPYILIDPETGHPKTQQIWDSKIKGFKTVNRYATESMYDFMMKNFDRLRSALRKSYGKFKYFRIFEQHKDGVPHLHVLFVGNSIVPKSFRGSLEKLWKKYGMGFIKVNTIKDKNGRSITYFNDVRHAVNYMLKYLTKDITKPGPYKRIFSCSQETLLKTEKKEWEIMEIIYGSFDDQGNIVEKMIDEYEMEELILAELIPRACGSPATVFQAREYDIKKPDIVSAVMNRHLQTLSRKEGFQDDCES